MQEYSNVALLYLQTSNCVHFLLHVTLAYLEEVTHLCIGLELN